jgi:hypothetical protein
MWKSLTPPEFVNPSEARDLQSVLLRPAYNRLSFWEEFWPTTICGTGSKHSTAPAN